MQPALTVVVLNFNRLNETVFTLEHLINLKNQMPDMEIIAVDNASSDGTPDYLKSMTGHARVMQMPSNIGIKAINRACMKALGKYVLVLDDDSHPVDATCLDRIIEILDSDMKIGAVACRIESASGKRVREWHLPDTDAYGVSPAFIGCGFAIRKNLFDRIGFFPSDFFLYQNEIEVAIRLRLEGYDVVFDPSCRIVHRFVPSGRTNARRVFYPTRNSLWLIRKYFDFPVSLYLIFCRIIFGFIRAVEGREFRTFFRAVSEGLGKDVRKRTLKGREKGFASVLLKQNSIIHHLFRG